ncbi:MAG: prephenate dehydratase [Kiritimatiellia bacterium]|nr:prephenate dehydratase [Kiritimatiellia bacterium]
MRLKKSEAALRTMAREVLPVKAALRGKLCVAYLGPSATFTHQAARSHFGGVAEMLPAETISDVFALVEKDTAQRGVVPIENSAEGAVTHTLDEFANTSLLICDEIYLAVSHCLLSRGSRAGIRKLYSHPQVFGQCRNRLLAGFPGVEQIPVSSTARAAELAAAEPGSAALAGRLAAELYGLKVLEDQLEDRRGNRTRFLVLGKTLRPRTGCDKTSLRFAVAHRAGALVSALEVFRRHRINMTRIESRPSRQQAWEYVFFVDIEGHRDDASVAVALSELKELCTLCTVLGSYPVAPDQPRAAPRQPVKRKARHEH